MGIHQGSPKEHSMEQSIPHIYQGILKSQFVQNEYLHNSFKNIFTCVGGCGLGRLLLLLLAALFINGVPGMGLFSGFTPGGSVLFTSAIKRVRTTAD